MTDTTRARRRGWLAALIASGILLAAAVLLVAGREDVPPLPDEPGTPQLRVDRDSVDLGPVALGQWAETSFTLTNAGDASLRFTGRPYVEVVEGCCPPAPLIGSMVLAPGDSTTLSLRFMMAGNMGGPHDFRVHLPSNDTLWGDRTLRVLSDWVEAGR
jgi:hypothetical protein